MGKPATFVPKHKIVVCYSSGRSGSTNLQKTLCSVPGCIAIDEVLIGLIYGPIGKAVLKERLEFEARDVYGAVDPDLSFIEDCHPLDIIDQYATWLSDNVLDVPTTHVFVKINAQQLIKAVNSNAELQDRVLFINIKRDIIDIVASRITAEYIAFKARKLFNYGEDMGADKLLVAMSPEEIKLLSRVANKDDEDLQEFYWQADNLINVEIMVVQLGQYIQSYYKALCVNFSDMIKGEALPAIYEYVGLEGDDLPTTLVKERVVQDNIKIKGLRGKILEGRSVQPFYFEG